MPSHGIGHFSLILGMFGCGFSIFCDNMVTHVDVWVVKVYGIKESWIKMLIIEYPKDPFVDYDYMLFPPSFISNKCGIWVCFRSSKVKTYSTSLYQIKVELWFVLDLLKSWHSWYKMVSASGIVPMKIVLVSAWQLWFDELDAYDWYNRYLMFSDWHTWYSLLINLILVDCWTMTIIWWLLSYPCELCIVSC